MAKIHPHLSVSETNGSCHVSAKQETFTIWMRSLMFNGHGCTVFDSKGTIVYRIDNYDCKNCKEVFLMDLSGKVLFTLLKKKFIWLGCWEGYRQDRTEIEQKKPSFVARNSLKILTKGSMSSCKVTAGLDQNQQRYLIRSCRSIFTVEDTFGRVVAEVKRKMSAKGGDLGEDVTTLKVEPHVDHSFIMALVVVQSLIGCKMYKRM